MIRTKDTNSEYHDGNDAISASGLKAIYQKSVFHFLNQKPFVSSPSMNFGSAVHSHILEPELDEILVLPEDTNLRLKAHREKKEKLERENSDKIIITYKDKQSLDKIVENIKSNKLAMNLINNITEAEYSYYGEYQGVNVKIRPDGIKQDRYILDIKTCQDASPKAFRSAVYKYAYHLQACFYSEMLGYSDIKNQFKFIAIENQHPFDVAVYSLSDDLIEKGKMAWRQSFNNWKNYKEKNLISGYYWEDINEDGSYIL